MNIEEPIMFDDIVDFDDDFVDNTPPPVTKEPDVITPPIVDDFDDDDSLDDDITPPAKTADDDFNNDDPTPNDEHDVSGYYDFLKQYGVIDTPDDFEFDGTVDGFNKALETSRQVTVDKIAKSLWEQLPDDFKPLLSYALNGGTSLDNYLNAYASPNLDEIDLDDEMTQRQVVERYYLETSSHPKERIEKMINKLAERGDLYDEALDAVEVLKDLQEKNKANLIEQAKLEQKAREDAAAAQLAELTSSIDKAEFLDDARKSKVKNFVLAPVLKDKNRTATQFDRNMADIYANPDHFVQLADLLMEYDPKEGFNFERLKRKAKTENTKAFKKLLDQTFNKPKGSARKPIQEDFN